MDFLLTFAFFCLEGALFMFIWNLVTLGKIRFGRGIINKQELIQRARNYRRIATWLVALSAFSGVINVIVIQFLL